MSTAIAFMVARVEEKIVYPDVDPTTRISALKSRVLPDLQSHNVDVQDAAQIRLIYSGRILQDADQVASIISPEIESPYTFQVLIRPPGAPDQPAQNAKASNDGCILL
jgi:hypothetical protein